MDLAEIERMTSGLDDILLRVCHHGSSHGGMGDVKISFHPYESHWICVFNWSNNQPITATGDTIGKAISSAIQAVQDMRNKSPTL